MKPDDIKAETFYEAYEAALKNTPEDRRAEDFVATLTRILIEKLMFEGVESAGGSNQEKAEEKIKKALEGVIQKKGIEFVTSQRVALQMAFDHELALGMTPSDFPPSSHQSGLFKLDLPADLLLNNKDK